jgi:uncharacterized protein
MSDESRTGLRAKGAKYWIEKLQLVAHPEGGYFRQTYISNVKIAREALPAGFGGARAASTAIYFLLEGENFSAFHRLRSDELWHFYAGTPLVVHVIEPGGKYSLILLGNGVERGEVFQAVVKAGCWFASEVVTNSHVWQNRPDVGHPQPLWALVGCTVAPGFDFEDFEIGKREELVREFSQHRVLIQRLTRE